MLTHELNNFTMSEAVTFYAQLKAAFKYIVPMGVATNVSQPYVETNISLPNFEQCPFLIWLCNDVTNTFPDISGTTTLGGSVVLPTGSTGGSSSSPSSPASQASGAGHSFGPLGGLAVSAGFVGSMLRLLM